MKHRTQLGYQGKTRIYGTEFDRKLDYNTVRKNGREDWLLIYTLHGAGTIRWKGMDKTVGAGSLLLYEPGSSQDYGTSAATGRWHFLWAHFYAPERLHRLMDWPSWKPGIRMVSVPENNRRPEIASAMNRAIRYSGSGRAPAEELAFLGLEEIFHLVRLEEIGSPLASDPRLRKVMDHLRQHYKEPFELEKMAALAGLSVSRFSFLFRKQTGKTAQEFLEKCRLEHAAQLLQLTQLNVSEVAWECGYPDPLYFSRRFKGFHGTSPALWLRQFRSRD